jgi:hypothetical protein
LGVQDFVRLAQKYSREQLLDARATISNHLADYVVKRDDGEKWVENRTRLFIHEVCDNLAEPIRTGHWKAPRRGNDKTTYVIGLYGTGRWYICGLMQQALGERAKYIRHWIRFHARPTSMIYFGHATIRHVSRGQRFPVITSRILKAVDSECADLIFVYRHPLDALLTNWVWWRTYVHERRMGRSITEDYKSADDLCTDLERDFAGFEAFASGDPTFYAGLSGPPFLSFSEFVEETELFIEAATLALRLEDFMVDPSKELSKIAEVMSVRLDAGQLTLVRPRTIPYRFLSVKEKVPRFKNFIDTLDARTRGRIEKIGYVLS